MVVARVDHGVAHGAERAEHGRAAVLELARERARARGGVRDLLRERVAAGDGARRAVVPPGRFCGPPVYCDAGMATVSAMPPKRRIWARPNVGTLESAAKPMPSLRMSENWTEPSRVMEPGKVMPSSWTIMPRNAIMEMRPCLISTCGKSVERRASTATRSP